MTSKALRALGLRRAWSAAALALWLGACANGSAPTATGGASGMDASSSKDAAPSDGLSPQDASVKGDVVSTRDAAADAVFWSTAFVPGCTPSPIGGRPQNDGHHRPGEDCMQAGCHLGASPDAGAPFLFAGTVRRAGSLALYPSVEIAVKAGPAFFTACSASNGNFWVSGSGGASLDWATATARVRTSNGETAMLPPPEPGCNTCHTPALLLTAP